MSNMSKRTDAHRPGAIVPAHYESWVNYSLPTTEGNFPIPAIGVDCTRPYTTYDAMGRSTGIVTPTCLDTGRCCVRSAERQVRDAGQAVFGAAGKCGVCGACFVYGTLHRHESGELVHMGHDCSDKYEMMQDLSAWELENGRTRRALATAIQRAQNAQARDAFLAAHPGLADAFELGSTDEGASKGAQIIADIHARFVQWLSDKQIALVLKLADEIRNPQAVIGERHCAAPVGNKRVTFTGEVVSAKLAKLAKGFRGGFSVKMTVKITAEDGATWLAYGTAPSALTDAYANYPVKEMRGRMVEVTAHLQLPHERRGDENHFAFMNRPAARFVDLVDRPAYQRPKCVIGQPCLIIKKQAAAAGEWAPIICDGHCGNTPEDPKATCEEGVNVNARGPGVTAVRGAAWPAAPAHAPHATRCRPAPCR